MIDLTQTEIAMEPQEKTPYIWRVSGVACRKSKDNNNLRLDMRATIVEGAQAGFEAKFPVIMLFDSTGQNRTTNWIGRAKLLLGKILGDPSEVTDLPSIEGEVTPTMKKLINAFFEATATYVKASNGFEAHWEVGRVLGPADPSTVVEVDWEGVFN